MEYLRILMEELELLGEACLVNGVLTMLLTPLLQGNLRTFIWQANLS